MDSTHVRPGDGASWIDSPYARDGSQRVAQGGTASRAEVNDHGSKTTATIALILAGGAVIGLIVASILVPHLISAMVDKGNAEVRASVQQQLSDTRALAQTAKEHARVALDKVEQTQVQLGAKGLIKPSTH